MSSDVRRPWAEIEPDATELARILAPACVELKIGGSARRGRKDISDVELVAIPRQFDEGNALHFVLDALLAESRVEKAKLGETQTTKWGQKNRALVWRGVKYDIYMTDADSWGYQLWLRTGPGDANEYVARRLKSAPFKTENGAVWQNGERIPVQTEDDWFRLLNLPYLRPQERTLDRYMELMPRRHSWGVVSVMTAASQSVEWDRRLMHKSGRVWVRRDDVTTHKYSAEQSHVGKQEWYVSSKVVFDLLPRDTPAATSWMRNFAARPSFLQNGYLDELTRWKAERLPVADRLDAGDLPMYYCLAGDAVTELFAIADLTSTEETYSPVTVAEYIAAETLLNDDGELPIVARFADCALLLDGEHRKRAAAARGLTHIEARVTDYDETFAQACGIMEVDEDDDFLADILEEALNIMGAALYA